MAIRPPAMDPPQPPLPPRGRRPPAPSRNDEWLFYQTLIGIWPSPRRTREQLEDLTARLVQYMEKATHEAKLRTSWISPNPAYDEAVQQFVTEVLADRSGRFLADVERFVRSIAPSGLWNSASQVLLKILSPGIPDLYQGQELWDFSLVDPDNRRPSRTMTSGANSWTSCGSRTGSADERVGTCRGNSRSVHREIPCWKLYVTHTALQVRQSDTFLDAEYVPLPAGRGDRAGHVYALRRGRR